MLFSLLLTLLFAYARGSLFDPGSRVKFTTFSCQEDLYTDCVNNQMLCYGLPDSCVYTGKCDVLFRSSYNNDTNILSLEVHSGPIPKKQYVAAAFDAGGGMAGIVVECYTWDDKPLIDFSINSGGNAQIANQSDVKGFTNMQASYQNGQLHCHWQVEPSGEVTYKNNKYSLTKSETFIKLATGPVQGLGQVERHTHRSVSSSAVNLRSKGIASSAGTPALIKWHGALMILGWVGWVTTGVIIARYARDQYSNTTLLGLRIWFWAHRISMAIGWLMILTAYICILVYAKKFLTDSVHSVAGFVAIILATLQIMNSFARPDPDSKLRWIFDYAHWFMGSCAHFLALINIWRVSESRGSPAFVWVFVGYVFIYLFFTDILRKIHLRVKCLENEHGHSRHLRLHETVTVFIILAIFASAIVLAYLLFRFG